MEEQGSRSVRDQLSNEVNSRREQVRAAPGGAGRGGAGEVA